MVSNTLLLIILLMAVILCLVLGLIAFLKSNKALKKAQRGSIEQIVKSEVENYVRLNCNQQIEKYIHEELLRQQQQSVSQKLEQKSEVVKSATSPVKDEKPAESKIVQETNPDTKPVEITLPEPVTLYTGICKDGAFKHVTTVPDNKTIFTILADSKDAVEGTLNVDESAYDKISQTPDYLQNACDCSGNGTRLKVIKVGSVVKENGSWVVKEPILVELN